MEVITMQTLIKAVALAALVAAPIVSFAQTNDPVTRAQVRQDLQQVEAAGYNPAASNDPNYPADIQAAEAKVAVENGETRAQNPVADTGYGSGANGSSQSGGTTVQPAGTKSVYFGN
jgi:hypothetical protein